MANNALTLTEMQSYARSIVSAKFCGFTNADEVITLALIAQDEGRSIGSVARDYHIIKGKPTLKADAMLARFQEAGGKVAWKELSDSRCCAEFSHPSSGTFSLEWTFEMAKKAGLTGNPTWQKFPRAMLRARVISEGIRTAYPAVICGTYTPEEVEDMEDEKPKARIAPKKEAVIDTETPMNPPSRMKATDAPVVQDAEIVSPETKADPVTEYTEKLKKFYKETPDAFKVLSEWMAEQGWNSSKEVPPERFKDVYDQMDYILAHS